MNIFQTLTVHAVHDGLKTFYRLPVVTIPGSSFNPGYGRGSRVGLRVVVRSALVVPGSCVPPV